LDCPASPLYSLVDMIAETPATLTTADGVALQARLSAPSTPEGGAVICHPHPLYGGDMDNPVVIRLAEVFGELGLATLRFNFRGVGESAGAHGHGVDEQHDVEAAHARVAALVGAGHPLILAGYSFGAAVVAEVAARHPELAGVVLAAPPLARVDPKRFAGLAPFGERLLVIAGSVDEICPAEALTRLHELTPDAAVQVVDAANHFFFGKLYPLGQAVSAWTRQILRR
jgi:alpha/beta superfamily hydrolase